MAHYGDLKLGQLFTRNDWEFTLRKGRGWDTVMETGVSVRPPAAEVEVFPVGPEPILNDGPTDVERAAVSVLTVSGVFAVNPLLYHYIEALVTDPNEFRHIDEFVVGHEECRRRIDEGWIGPRTDADEWHGRSAFTAIWDTKPRGVNGADRDERLVNAIDAAKLALASAIADYRRDGRPNGDQTHTIYGTGRSPLLNVSTSLAAEIGQFHNAVRDAYEYALRQDK